MTSPMPFVDGDLARRLERVEASANAAYVEARAALRPASGATWTDVAGVYAMYDGPESPLTQTFGLGLFGAVGTAEFDEMEAFFSSRGAPVHHEVSPFIDPAALSNLGTRGYRPIEFSNVLVRPVSGEVQAGSEIEVQRLEADEEALWSRTAAAGWRSESPELGDFVQEIGEMFGLASGTHRFLATVAGQPAAAAALSLHEGIALLAGAATVPEFRRRGAQNALLKERLRFAAAAGAELAMMVAQPGSGSQRNAERQGFRVGYTRTKWYLPAAG